ncbi:MAG: hypothetical protein AABY13_04395, partial [Nanoarchaeota archaeon]
MTLDIIVKANDGRGMGHICRVMNWVGYEGLRHRSLIMVHRDYAHMVPWDIEIHCVADMGYRVDLDMPQGALPGSIIEKFAAKNKIKNVTGAVAAYYRGLRNALHKDAAIFYLDDQNGMETVFIEEVGRVLGEDFPTLRELMPKGRIAAEIETQFIDDSRTRMRALQAVDYIHLSCDASFFRLAAPDFSLGGLEDKVIPMGLSLSDNSRRIFDGVMPNRYRLRDELLKDFGVLGTCKSFVYCTFGAGEGADEVMPIIYEVAKERKDVFFGITDPRGELAKEFTKRDIGIKNKTNDGSQVQVGGLPNLCLFKSSPETHLQRVAIADASIQGNGSGTTYESIYAQTPSVNIPLRRPGYEQLIKG